MMTEKQSTLLRDGERLDDLGDGLHIIQHPDRFRFGTDAVLLSRFVKLRDGERVADLGTGSCVLPLLLHNAAKELRFDAIEIQEDLADMAKRSVELNKLEASIKVINADIKTVQSILGYGKYDAVLCNPPYDKPDSSWPIGHESHRIARSEVLCTLSDVTKAMAVLLRNGGRAYMIHRASRMVDVLDALRSVKLEAKTLQLAYASWDKPASFMIVEAVKQGGTWLNVLKPLLI